MHATSTSTVRVVVKFKFNTAKQHGEGVFLHGTGASLIRTFAPNTRIRRTLGTLRRDELQLDAARLPQPRVAFFPLQLDGGRGRAARPVARAAGRGRGHVRAFRGVARIGAGVDGPGGEWVCAR